MSKPVKNWQNTIWREWRNCEDEEYARQLFDSVADEPVGWRVWTTIIFFCVLAGAMAGLPVGWLVTNWHTFYMPNQWALEWPALRSFAEIGGAIGGVGGFLIRVLAYPWLSWRAWLAPRASALFDEVKMSVMVGVMVGVMAGVIGGVLWGVERIVGLVGLVGAVVGEASGLVVWLVVGLAVGLVVVPVDLALRLAKSASANPKLLLLQEVESDEVTIFPRSCLKTHFGQENRASR
jgi:hypothetical protein